MTELQFLFPSRVDAFTRLGESFEFSESLDKADLDRGNTTAVDESRLVWARKIHNAYNLLGTATGIITNDDQDYVGITYEVA